MTGIGRARDVETTATSYVDDVNGSLPNVLTDGTLKYVYGLGLAHAVDGSGNLQICHTDGLGSVRAITNGSGTVIATYKTDPFGVPLKTKGNSSQPFQYTGQQRDAESGLYDLRARMYDPAIGRFLQWDPLVGSVANPLSLDGLCSNLDRGGPSRCGGARGPRAGARGDQELRLRLSHPCGG